MDRWSLVASSDGRVGARIDGELDLANGRDLVGFLASLLIEPGQRVEVDLSGVVFIDSCGLQALLNAHRLTEERGAELLLIEPSRQVRRLLELTGCVNIFTVVSSGHESAVDGVTAAGQPGVELARLAGRLWSRRALVCCHVVPGTW